MKQATLPVWVLEEQKAEEGMTREQSRVLSPNGRGGWENTVKSLEAIKQRDHLTDLPLQRTLESSEEKQWEEG